MSVILRTESDSEVLARIVELLRDVPAYDGPLKPDTYVDKDGRMLSADVVGYLKQGSNCADLLFDVREVLELSGRV